MIQLPGRVKSVKPTFQADSFTCPHCGVFSQMTWSETQANGSNNSERICLSKCESCDRFAIWTAFLTYNSDRRANWNATLVHPRSAKHQPHDQLPADVKRDFEEAANVLSFSPKASAALLRLAVQKLIPHAGETNSNLNEAIKSLVSKGLSPQIQQALDIVRITGNNAVHPGQMDEKDISEIADALFEIINLICEEFIAKPERIKSLYERLPSESLKQIKRRDAN
ncbi:MAG: DUF4145 domain-containing protein [Bdellovibrionales bacterium]|nr:DUF4145 domain-containing protein [Bdellovibrionales bacterium]